MAQANRHMCMCVTIADLGAPNRKKREPGHVDAGKECSQRVVKNPGPPQQLQIQIRNQILGMVEELHKFESDKVTMAASQGASAIRRHSHDADLCELRSPEYQRVKVHDRREAAKQDCCPHSTRKKQDQQMHRDVRKRDSTTIAKLSHHAHDVPQEIDPASKAFKIFEFLFIIRHFAIRHFAIRHTCRHRRTVHARVPGLVTANKQNLALMRPLLVFYTTIQELVSK